MVNNKMNHMAAVCDVLIQKL